VRLWGCSSLCTHPDCCRPHPGKWCLWHWWTSG